MALRFAAAGAPQAGAEREFVREVYGRRAKRYDFTANLYYLIGFREWALRRRAVAALGLKEGETVVEIGCGTGLNFPLLRERVGPGGRIVGVDLTDAMLAEARQRVARERWDNVTLVHGDALEYDFPRGVEGVLSTFALSLVPECGTVARRAADALAPGGRLVIADFKVPGWCPSWFVPVLLPLVAPFAVTRETIARRPWEEIRRAMEESLEGVAVEDFYFGLSYTVMGEKGGGRGD